MLKPFDLQKALAGDMVVTRDGRIVTGFHVFNLQNNNDNNETLYGVLAGDDNEWEVQYWFETGKYNRSSTESRYDLFMNVDTRWVNIYLDEDGVPEGLGKWSFHGYGYPTREMADDTAAKGLLIATVEIVTPKKG